MSQVKVELFEEIVKDFVATYTAKNSDYGDSFAKVREEYPHAIAIRLTDKLERLKVLLEQDYVPKVEESIEDTLKDVAVYSIMELIERELDKAYEETMKTIGECNCNECEEFYTSSEQAKEELIATLKEKYGDEVQIKFIKVKE